MLQVCATDSDPGKEHLDFENSEAWALVDHQFSHVFVKDRAAEVIDEVAKLFAGVDGIDQVLVGSDRGSLDHERSGDVVLVSSSNSWQAYYWWLDDEAAPSFAHTVDIHRKPGYDPVELCFDMATMSVPLDASLIRGSHGVPQKAGEEEGVLVCSDASALAAERLNEVQIFESVMAMFKAV